MCNSQQYTIIHAAGGIVTNENGEILMIFRRGKWDFPKGKVEPDESCEAAALREVTEETGVHGLQLGEALPMTQHTYDLHGTHILKHTHWYRMTAPAQVLIPQTEEDIEQALWVKPEQAGILLQENSYPTLIQLWQDYCTATHE